MLRPCIAGALLTLPLVTWAQISFGGRPIDLIDDTFYPEEAVVEFPAVDAARLLAEDEAMAASGVKGPLRFGVNHETDLNGTNSGIQTAFPDGTTAWRVVLHCPGAKSINLVFGEFIIPEGARVFVWNGAGEVLGAFRQASSGGQHTMGVAPLPGDRITIQFERPPGTAGGGSLRITQVTHGYRGFGDARGLGDSGSCNRNTICPEGDPWRDQIASVAMIVVNGNGWCTGQLINNCANNGTPYLLTADHCLNGQNPADWTFRFNWESPTCEPTAAGLTGNTVSGASLLENNANSDVALLQLNTTPPASYNVWYTGWDALGQTPESSTVIHHPSGDVKKISSDNDASLAGEFDGAECWHILDWDDGTTEGGSSGSGLWNPEGRLIGQLFGGQAWCENSVNDYFGRFDISYPLLTPWLGTCGTPVIDGYDPNASALQFDASVLAITGIEPNYCDTGSLSPVLTIRNNGTVTLTQLTVTYVIDTNGPNSFDWSGSLTTGGTTTIPLPDITAGSGVHVLTVTCTAPNGGVDGNPANDHMSRTFHIASPGETLTLTINTDDYGSETIWIVEAGGMTLYSGGPYEDVGGGTTETASFCLEEACFSFTIMDAAGDGICCQWGDGDYSITDSDGDVLLDGNGNFGDAATIQFCSGEAAIAEADRPDLHVFPDPSTGPITVAWPWTGDTPTLTVRDVLGRVAYRVRATTLAPFALDLSYLSAGRYTLEVVGVVHRSARVITLVR